MSLRSMAMMRAENEAAEQARRSRLTGPRAARDLGPAPAVEPDPALERARDQLIALIPTEAVALFILLIGATAEADVGVRIAMLALVAVLGPAWTLVTYWEAKGGRRGAGWPVFEMAIGTIAFLAWSTSVPASPFFDLDLPTWVGVVIVAVVSAGLVLAARARAVWMRPARPKDPREPEPAPAPAG